MNRVSERQIQTACELENIRVRRRIFGVNSMPETCGKGEKERGVCESNEWRGSELGRRGRKREIQGKKNRNKTKPNYSMNKHFIHVFVFDGTRDVSVGWENQKEWVRERARLKEREGETEVEGQQEREQVRESEIDRARVRERTKLKEQKY